MATFPRRESELVALMKSMISGMRNAPEEYASAPLGADELEAMLSKFQSDHTATVEADAIAKQRHTAKDQSQEKLKNGLRKALRYAEVINREAPDKLLSLGWAPPRSPTRSGSPGRVPPGQVRNLAIRGEGATWVMLEWEAPADGGRVAAYNIRRRLRKGDNDWEHAASSTTTQMLLKDQPRGVELEYQVVAFNRAGTGTDSNVVTLVL
jgi:hypothetical protein